MTPGARRHRTISVLRLMGLEASLTVQRIRVAHIIGQLSVGGAERQFVELLKNLDRSVYEPTAITLSSGGELARELDATGVSLRVVERRSRFDPRPVLRIAKALKVGGFTIAHTWGIYAGLYGRLAAVLARTPITVASDRQTTSWHKGASSPLYHAIDRLLSRWTTATIANSNAVQRYTLSKGISPRKIRVIYNGVDVTRYAHGDAQRVRSELRLEPDTPTVGVIARLDPMKGHRCLLLAVPLVLRAMPRTRFLVAGEGFLRDELTRLTVHMGLQSSVCFLGLRSDVPDLLAALDVLVLPSKEGEGLPNVLLEAMAAAKPVIATAVGGNAEIVVHGQTGFLVRPEDPAALARSITQVLRDPYMARTMGRTGFRRVTSVFSMRRMVQGTQDLYLTLLREKALI